MRCKRFPLGGLWTNGYLFSDPEGVSFFIDPGGDMEEVLEHLRCQELTLKAVLLTHGHLDHISGVESFVPFVGGEVYISPEDAPNLEHPSREMQRYLGVECREIKAFKTVTEGDVLSIGEFSVKVLATPGHTLGSVCYLISLGEESVLASGDTLFTQSVGRTDLPGGDTAQLMESLRRLAQLPDRLVVLPGHGPDTTIGVERKLNPFWPQDLT